MAIPKLLKAPKIYFQDFQGSLCHTSRQRHVNVERNMSCHATSRHVTPLTNVSKETSRHISFEIR